MENRIEIWKPVVGYEGLYEVSSFGRVRSLDRICPKGRIRKGKSKKLTIDKKGYLTVGLSKNSHRKLFKVHRLVAGAFMPNTNNLPMINHKDENKQNNMIWVNDDGSIDYDKSNLEWCTAKYNANYGTSKERIRKKMITNNPKSMLGKFGKEHPNSKPINQYTKDDEFIKSWDSIRDVEREMGYSVSNISCCLRGKTNTAYGYIWKYKRTA